MKSDDLKRVRRLQDVTLDYDPMQGLEGDYGQGPEGTVSPYLPPGTIPQAPSFDQPEPAWEPPNRDEAMLRMLLAQKLMEG